MIHYRQALLSAAFLAALVFTATAARAQSPQFSADLVAHAGAAAPFWDMKLNVRGAQIRIQPNPKAAGYYIADMGRHVSYQIIPEMKRYTEDNAQYAFNVIGEMSFQNPNNACAEAEARARERIKKQPNAAQKPAQDYSCHKVGAETLKGRSTIKYEMKFTDYKGHPATGVSWVDTKIGYIIRMEGMGVVTELQNIQETSQSASLFELPAGYQKYAPGKP